MEWKIFSMEWKWNGRKFPVWNMEKSSSILFHTMPCLWVAFTSDGGQDKELNIRIGKTSATTRSCTIQLWWNENCHKKQSSQFPVFLKQSLPPIPTYCMVMKIGWWLRECDRKCKCPKWGFYWKFRSYVTDILTRCTSLRFENFYSRYFPKLKNLSLDGLALQAECLRKNFQTSFTCQSKRKKNKKTTIGRPRTWWINITSRIVGGITRDFTRAK